MQYKRLIAITIAPVIITIVFAGKNNAQSSEKRLRTIFTGDNKCLDIINDGQNNKLQMANCGNYSGQFWKIEPLTNPAGYSRLKTIFTGDNKCLDIINDGQNNKLQMANCGNYSGQFWKIEPLTNPAGYSRLKTIFTGDNKCLDIINDGQNNKLQMANCGNYSGQFWESNEKLVKPLTDTAPVTPTDEDKPLLKKGTSVTWREKLAADIKKRYASGESIAALEASTGQTYGFIHRILTESGVDIREDRVKR